VIPLNPDGADVLLVDDNSNDVAVALDGFRRHAMEHRVKVLGDGAAVVDYLLGASEEGRPVPQPRVILMDLNMPRLDGRGVLRLLRADERTRHIPVVIVTSSTREADRRECYSLGADDFVVKDFDPVRPGEFAVDAVRRWLEPVSDSMSDSSRHGQEGPQWHSRRR
jgi:two-component system response regulator